MEKITVGIDFGHGHQTFGNLGGDGGAVGYLAEEEIINSVGWYIVNKLKNLGYNVVELRPSYASSVSNSLYERYTKADNSNCDVCISLHANAGGGHGVEVFTYNSKNVYNSNVILSNIVNLGFTNRGIKNGNGLAMVRRPSMPAMLIELCFVDSKDDTNLYTNLGAEALANAIVNGLTGSTTDNRANGYKVGWNEDENGWWYAVSEWTFCKSEWKEIDGSWYYFNGNGYAYRNQWALLKNKWYWFNEDCRMAEGSWKQDSDGKYYYLSDNGDMLTNSFVSDKSGNGVLYYVGDDGIMKCGELFTIQDGRQFYAYEDGVVAIGAALIFKDKDGNLKKAIAGIEGEIDSVEIVK